MKKHVLSLVILGIFLFSSDAFAGVFIDNFNDGNADGWWLGYSHHTPWVQGDWRVESGVLVEKQGGADQFVALVENLPLSNQVIETQVKLSDSGGGGITTWYQDYNNWIMVGMYPDASFVYVFENINSSFYVNNPERYIYQYTASRNTWYDLKVDVDSASGELAVYIDDAYLFTYDANTPYRSGLSGVNCNGGNYFDNFRLTSNDIAPVPEPASMVLFGIGGIATALLRRKKNLS